MEMSLTGRDVPAQEAMDWGLVNGIAAVDGDGESVQGGVVQLAIKWANVIGENSPDSVIASKEGVELGWEGLGVEEASQRLLDGKWEDLQSGENIKEGLRAFVEKRKPRWAPSKL